MLPLTAGIDEGGQYFRYFLSTGGTSTGEPVRLSVCVLSVLQKIIEIGLVIIVYTPVLSTTWSYWF